MALIINLSSLVHHPALPSPPASSEAFYQQTAVLSLALVY